jgi:hypothetical protein
MSIRPLCIVPGEGSRRIQIGAYLSATHLPYAYRVSPDGEEWGPWWPYKVHQEEIAHLVVLAARPFDQAARILELEVPLAELVTRLRKADICHLWVGNCPDSSQPDARDSECPACKILLAAEATLRGETRP